MAQQKVASWYWVTTAALTPLVLLATLIWVYYMNQVSDYRAEGQRMVLQVEQNHEQFDPLQAHMLEVAAVTGFKMGSIDDKAGEEAGRISAPSYFQGEERSLPPEKQSPLLRAYIDAESRFYGAAEGETGYVHNYAGARAWLDEFEGRLERYIAAKAYQYYTVQTIQVGDTTVGVAAGSLSRSIENQDGLSAIPSADQDTAYGEWQSGKEPSDPTLRKPTQITLELLFRKQVQLIRDLANANQHQYGLLVSGVAGKIEDEDGTEYWVGFRGEQERLNSLTGELDTLIGDIDDMKDAGIEKLEDAGDFASTAGIQADADNDTLAQKVLSALGRIDTLQGTFSAERTAHEEDADKYLELIRNLPRLKSPIKLEKADADGEVTYSDYTRGTVHINLGHADGVRVGQRFEIWRTHGFEKDEFVGVLELVRTLSPHFSLCTILELTDPDDYVREGDKIVSHLWHNGEFLTVALHGSYEPPNEAYSRERLTELLKLKGLRVVEKVQPGTDLVILGSNLLGDEWYRKARNDLRFETLREDDVRLYVDPR